MSSIPGKNRGVKRDFWYALEWEPMLDISARLTPIEYAFLHVVIMLMYRNGGSVPDDGTYIVKHIRSNTRAWKPIREKFIAEGYIRLEDSRLCSRFYDEERAEADTRRKTKGRREKYDTRIDFEKHNEKNGVFLTDTPTHTEEKIDIGERAPARTESSRNKESGEKETQANLTSSPTPGSETSDNSEFVPRGRRGLHPLPDDCAPSPENIAYALSKGWARDVVLLEAERFINYHRMHDKRFKDWNLVWRNWVVSPYFGASSKNERAGKLTVQEAAWNLHERVAALAAEISPGFGDEESGNIVRLLPQRRC
jgi:Protein of unknown function (DUF1376)